MHYYIRALKNYVNFKGRDTRPQFWYFYLVHFIIGLVLAIIDELMGFELLAPLYGLAVLLPMLAIMTRRLHDTGKSGWWILALLFTPIGLGFVFLIIGGLIFAIAPGLLPLVSILLPILLFISIIAVFVYIFAAKGEDKPNKYGDVPKMSKKEGDKN